MLETIKVVGAGKFGPNTENGWYSLSQKSGIAPEAFAVGQVYDVDIYVSKPSEKGPGGKKYINSIVRDYSKGELLPAAPSITHTSTVTSKTPDVKAFSPNIVDQAIYKSILEGSSVTQFATSFDDYRGKVEELAEAIISKIKSR